MPTATTSALAGEKARQGKLTVRFLDFFQTTRRAVDALAAAQVTIIGTTINRRAAVVLIEPPSPAERAALPALDNAVPVLTKRRFKKYCAVVEGAQVVWEVGHDQA